MSKKKKKKKLPPGHDDSITAFEKALMKALEDSVNDTQRGST